MTQGVKGLDKKNIIKHVNPVIRNGQLIHLVSNIELVAGIPTPLKNMSQLG